MVVQLRDLEPFNVPLVDNERAAIFMQHLTGNETFEWAGAKSPRCLMIFQVEYAYPERCVAHAVLFAMSVDALVAVCESASGDMGDVIDGYAIGSLRIEYGGGLPSVAIQATESVPGRERRRR
jgi:hypothetical protein